MHVQESSVLQLACHFLLMHTGDTYGLEVQENLAQQGPYCGQNHRRGLVMRHGQQQQCLYAWHP